MIRAKSVVISTRLASTRTSSNLSLKARCNQLSLLILTLSRSKVMKEARNSRPRDHLSSSLHLWTWWRAVRHQLIHKSFLIEALWSAARLPKQSWIRHSLLKWNYSSRMEGTLLQSLFRRKISKLSIRRNSPSWSLAQVWRISQVKIKSKNRMT